MSYEAMSLGPSAADRDELARQVARLERENAELRATQKQHEGLLQIALDRLLAVEWDGYLVTPGERACPNCDAWAYQHGKEKPEHGYACALEVAIAAIRAELKRDKP